MRDITVFSTATVTAVLLTLSAWAQPVQPPPATSAPVSALLANAPSVTISNDSITAKVARIDAARGFYNGTRFDQAGVITGLTLNGREFYGPWFERTAPDVLDYTYVGDKGSGVGHRLGPQPPQNGLMAHLPQGRALLH